MQDQTYKERKMADKNNSERPFDTLLEKIKDIQFAMLTTVDAHGELRSRPFTTLKTEDDGTLWFFMNGDTPTARELQNEPQVNLSYAKPDKNMYVSVSGTAALTRDRAKMKEIWNPALQAWFPDGLDDPNLTLLRVKVAKAEYWDSPSNKMVELAGMVKAILTRTEFDEGENEKLNIRNPS
jgi:general stress protein 26